MENAHCRDNNFKTTVAIIGVILTASGILAAISKAYFQTPMKLEEHERAIHELQATDAATIQELRAQRDILLEIRSDLKYVKQNSQP